MEIQVIARFRPQQGVQTQGIVCRGKKGGVFYLVLQQTFGSKVVQLSTTTQDEDEVVLGAVIWFIVKSTEVAIMVIEQTKFINSRPLNVIKSGVHTI